MKEWMNGHDKRSPAIKIQIILISITTAIQQQEQRWERVITTKWDIIYGQYLHYLSLGASNNNNHFYCSELITRGDRSIPSTTNRGTHVLGALRYTHGHQESHIKGREPVGIKVIKVNGGWNYQASPLNFCGMSSLCFKGHYSHSLLYDDMSNEWL